MEFVNLHTDPETGRSKGFAFVQYRSPEDAKKALQHCNGLELAGRQLKVGLVTETKSEVGLGSDTLDDEGIYFLSSPPGGGSSVLLSLLRN